MQNGIRRWIALHFPALTHRNFRLFWFGQCVSLIGTWMQNIGQAWLVLKITDSSFKLGLVSALQFTPVLLLSLFAGVIVDRLPKRRILIFTQTVLMILALILATLTATGKVRYWHILVLAAILGFVNNIDMPARQSFIVELVGKEHLMNGITLNSTIFNAARLIGPAVAGFVMGFFGIAVCFFLNALSFLAVILGLLMIKIPSETTIVQDSSKNKKPVLENIKEGLTYIKNTPPVFITVILMALISTFSLNFNVLVPVLAKKGFGLTEEGFGFMMSSLGSGALIGSIMLAATTHKPTSRILIGAALGLSAAQIILGTVNSQILAMVFLALTGWMMVTFTASANSTIQVNTPDHLRGRVMSVYSLVFAGVAPLGSLFAGSLAGRFGARAAFATGGFIGIIAAGIAVCQIIKFHKIASLKV
jgi:MFS family permease